MFALHKMTSICVDCASRYDIVYNEKKRKLTVFHGKRRCNINPNIEINGKTIETGEIVHLGNILSTNIFICDTSKCVTDIYGDCNSFLSHYKGRFSHVRSNLFLNFVLAFMVVSFKLV